MFEHSLQTQSLRADYPHRENLLSEALGEMMRVEGSSSWNAQSRQQTSTI